MYMKLTIAGSRTTTSFQSLPLRISPKPTALLPLLHLHSAVEGGRVAVQGRSTQEILKELRKQKPVADPANVRFTFHTKLPPPHETKAFLG